VVVVGLALALMTSSRIWGAAGEGSRPNLASLTLEELLEVEVSLVSRKAEPLFGAAAAVHVLTADDLRRAGVTSIPEALRLVPGVEVARIDASKWAVTARGFNGRFAQKLLVLIDGRSVYTPLFSGVYWEVQDVLLEDVERIEVIRGPGAALWGANAVNGVINIVTREARESQGLLVTLGSGTEEHASGAVRVGGRLGRRGHARFYLKGFSRDGLVTGAGEPAADGWSMRRSGVRADWDLSGSLPLNASGEASWPRRIALATGRYLSENCNLTVQGDLYDGTTGTTYRSALLEPPYTLVQDADTGLRGGNLLARWRRAASGTGELAVQVYGDWTDHDEIVLEERRGTYDLDFQHRFRLGRRQELTWGLGYRYTHDRTRGTFSATFDPTSRSTSLASGFVQSDLTLVEERLHLTVGTKLEQSDYTGLEAQPGVRAEWTPGRRQVVWAAVSHALRAPARADYDVRLNRLVIRPDSLFAGSPLILGVGLGNREFESEQLHAFELGYRVRPVEPLLVDLAGFYNRYHDLRGGKAGIPYEEIDPAPAHLVWPYTAANLVEGETHGLELAADWRPAAGRLRLRGAYSLLQMNLRVQKGGDPLSLSPEGESPEHQFYLWTALDPRPGVQLDGILRYVDSLPTVDADSYLVLDARAAWALVPGLELSVAARNLLSRRHPEFRAFFVDTVPSETQHELSAALRWHR
jgi:iron complex outermembrane receptor protein